MRAFLDDTAQIIGPFFKFHQEVKGRSEREKQIARFVLDKAELIYEKGKKIGGVRYLNPIEAFLQHLVYLAKYSKGEEGSKKANGGSAEFPPEELELRQSIVDFGNRLVSEGLVQGTWGNLSARLNDWEILVTPSGIDYARLTPQDIMKVDVNTLEFVPNGDLHPTSEKSLHAAIYRNRADVQGIVHTHASYCCVYAACEKDLGSEAKCAKYAFSGSKKLAANTAAALGSNIGAIMAHHGMVACGASLEEAFSNAKYLEETAKNNLSD